MGESKRLLSPHKRSSSKRREILEIYKRLYAHFGPQYWWPAETPFEVMIGAILTQNTSWKNVEKALSKLKEKDLLHSEALHRLPEKTLALLIRSSGYFNLKARRIKALMAFIFEKYGGSIDRMLSEKWEVLRDGLLSVKGIGPETADSILLYAGNAPIFVIDAYTRRIFERHSHIAPGDDYHKIQDYFMKELRDRTDLYNEYHALIVMTGKFFCKKVAACSACPLNGLLEDKVAVNHFPKI
ncbi:MAG TPA: endonuclease III domain-containing protein [Nitrospiria bacterium]|nr:endonuclease III domain-containing protein [Candidatus Manganitrophaceae bacterium]HIL34270.1 endonuclease III domain-containing protein [Candidatus Manganitrophaceae bacterium]